MSLRAALIGFFAFIALSAAEATPGQPGTLDPTFGSGGRVDSVTLTGLAFATAAAVVVQPDGKTIIAGSCTNATKLDFCALRLNVDGSFDSSFSEPFVAMSSGDDKVQLIALRDDGGVLLVGSCNGAICALKLLPNGSIDTRFGVNGKLFVAQNVSSGFSFSHQPDGKLVFGYGCVRNTLFGNCIVRHDASGAIDPSFGVAGESFHSGGVLIGTLVLQADGAFLVIGGCTDSSNETCVIRLSASGVRDLGYGLNGIARSNIGADSIDGRFGATQADGRLVVAATCRFGTQFAPPKRTCITRFTAEGLVDSTLSAGGFVLGAVNQGPTTQKLVVQPDGRLLLAGYCPHPSISTDVYCAERYHSDGSVDVSFNGVGRVTVNAPVGFTVTPAGAWLQSDGRLIIAATCRVLTGTSKVFCAIRLDGGPFGARSCSLDIDGDNRVFGTADAAIHSRVSRGVRGSAVVQGLNFASNATRTTWPKIRDFLVGQCGLSLPM